MRGSLPLVAAALWALAACSNDATSPDARPKAAFSVGESTPGAVYVMSNAAAGNAVLVFDRSADGTLTAAGSVPTGGLGTGSGLGTQGALALSGDGRWLLVVNAGSNELSAFRVGARGLEATDRVASGGTMPVSVTVSGSLVYVLNAGGSGNISGFTLSNDGRLTPIAGSTRSIGGPGTGAVQISFTPDGRVLVVAEKLANQIVTYTVGANGVASAPTMHASAGTTPFGFGFSGRSTLVISEAFGGAANASAVSTYTVGPDGGLTLVSGSVGTQQTAACWVAVTRNGRYAYATNNGSSSVSGFAIGADGSATPITPDGRTGVTGPGSRPLDADVSVNGRYLYVYSGGSGTISQFAVASDGSLTSLGDASGIPGSATGLVAQ